MSFLTEEKEKFLLERARAVRVTLVEMLTRAGSGHTAGPLGMADIFTALYFHILNHDPTKPDWSERDRLVLSNGHIVPIRYATMAHAGYFPLDWCMTLRQFGSKLQGHPERILMPSLETTSGPLGSGLSQAAGMAYAARMDGRKFRIVCAMSDGEHQSGNVWEAAMWAGKYRLSNLVAVIDRNNIQINGTTEQVMPLEPLREKYEAFNWHVIEINGHNMEEIVDAFETARTVFEKPTVIIAHTIPGKGVPEIEFDFRWHGKSPKKDEADKFIKAIRSIDGKVPNEYA